MNGFGEFKMLDAGFPLCNGVNQRSFAVIIVFSLCKKVTIPVANAIERLHMICPFCHARAFRREAHS